MSHTSHSSYHNPGYHGRLLYMPENEIGDSRGGGVRSGSRSQDIIHSYLHNDGLNVDGDGRSGFRSLTSPSPFHHSGDLCRSLYFYSCFHERSVHRSYTRQFLHITMVDYIFPIQGLLKNLF